MSLVNVSTNAAHMVQHVIVQHQIGERFMPSSSSRCTNSFDGGGELDNNGLEIYDSSPHDANCKIYSCFSCHHKLISKDKAIPSWTSLFVSAKSSVTTCEIDDLAETNSLADAKCSDRMETERATPIELLEEHAGDLMLRYPSHTAISSQLGTRTQGGGSATSPTSPISSTNISQAGINPRRKIPRPNPFIGVVITNSPRQILGKANSKASTAGHIIHSTPVLGKYEESPVSGSIAPVPLRTTTNNKRSASLDWDSHNRHKPTIPQRHSPFLVAEESPPEPCQSSSSKYVAAKAQHSPSPRRSSPSSFLKSPNKPTSQEDTYIKVVELTGNGSDDEPQHASSEGLNLVDALTSAFVQNAMQDDPRPKLLHPPKTAKSISSSTSSTTFASADSPSIPAGTGARKSYARQAKIVPPEPGKVSAQRQEELADLFDVDLAMVGFERQPFYDRSGIDMVRLNAHPYFAAKKGNGWERELRTQPKAFALPAKPRAERFLEVLEDTFGPGGDHRGSGRKPT